MVSYSKISKPQLIDSGMALVLILLLLGLFLDRLFLFQLGIICLVLTMSVPAAFRPFAWTWFGISEFISFFMSKLLLSGVFFLIVTPIGIVVRFFSPKLLLKREFKRSSKSVFVSRELCYSGEDLRYPY